MATLGSITPACIPITTHDLLAIGQRFGIDYRFPEAPDRAQPASCVARGRVMDVEIDPILRVTHSDLDVLHAYASTSRRAAPWFISVILGPYPSWPRAPVVSVAGRRRLQCAFQRTDRANTQTVPDCTLVDATIGYDLGHVGVKGVETRLNVSNLLDKDYVASCNSLEYCHFGAMRGVTASVHYRF